GLGGLEKARRRAHELAANRRPGGGHGASREHCAPAREGPDAEGDRIGITSRDGNVLEGDGESVRGGLRVERLVSLPPHAPTPTPCPLPPAKNNAPHSHLRGPDTTKCPSPPLRPPPARSTTAPSLTASKPPARSARVSPSGKTPPS